MNARHRFKIFLSGLTLGMVAALSGVYDVGEAGGWETTADGLYYQNFLNGDTEYESLYAEVSAGVRRRGESSILSLPASVAHISSGHDAPSTCMDSPPATCASAAGTGIG